METLLAPLAPLTPLDIALSKEESAVVPDKLSPPQANSVAGRTDRTKGSCLLLRTKMSTDPEGKSVEAEGVALTMFDAWRKNAEGSVLSCLTCGDATAIIAADGVGDWLVSHCLRGDGARTVFSFQAWIRWCKLEHPTAQFEVQYNCTFSSTRLASPEASNTGIN